QLESCRFESLSAEAALSGIARTARKTMTAGSAAATGSSADRSPCSRLGLRESLRMAGHYEVRPHPLSERFDTASRPGGARRHPGVAWRRHERGHTGPALLTPCGPPPTLAARSRA